MTLEGFKKHSTRAKEDIGCGVGRAESGKQTSRKEKLGGAERCLGE